ncbi:hypothetical protein INT45_014226 [Circinella minor]|uniref:Reverse transcriptase zinc-binding domain-containing protein n=1 Tax=Circinella minor TaxID=1195481 RepID=A0A8H7SE15_9FUNG|nr:hypothetical protein INT45_014226 [Circinella minor]
MNVFEVRINVVCMRRPISKLGMKGLQKGLQPGDLGNNDASSLLDSCTLLSSVTPINTRLYRQSYTNEHIHCSPRVKGISAAQWTKFWSLSMFSAGRNLWFRAVHRTLPTSQRLHDLIPEHRATNICQLCHITIDSSSHFLVSCPVRWSVWTRTWGPIFLYEPDERNLLRVIMDLRWDLIHTRFC